MKRRSREINVFSISALDLFASALGAFILIMVVLLPYFPNTGDSAERVAEVQEELKKIKAKEEEAKKITEALKGKLEVVTKENGALKGEVAKRKGDTAKQVKLPHIDLVVALDTTGSMTSQIAGLKTELAGLAQILTKLSPSFGMGVIGFKDRTDTPVISSVPLRRIRMNTQSMRDLQSFVNGLTAGSNPGNIENEEAIGAALRAALAMRWRPRSELRVIVIISDHGAYVEEVQATLDMARQFSGTDGQKISTVLVVTPTGASASALGYLPKLAEAGQGRFVVGGGSMTAAILQALLKS